MRLRGKTFEVDRDEGKLLGVCAGIANATGIDATIIRIGLVALTLFHGFPWTVIAYGVLALVGQRGRGAAGGNARSFGRSVARSSGHRPDRVGGTEESRERMRNLDLRMQAIETYVTSANSSLAREIDELR